MDVYLPIANLAVDGLVIVALGVATGILSGVFGVGGGFLTTPLLIFYGIPPTVAAASAATQVTGASVSGVFAHSRKQGVDYQMGGVTVAGGMVGALLGAVIFNLLRAAGQIDVVINVLYVVMLGTIGGLMARESMESLRNASGKSGQRPAKRRHHPMIASLPYRWRFYRSGLYISPLGPLILGVIVGILTMLMGVGGGFHHGARHALYPGHERQGCRGHQPVQHPVHHHAGDDGARLHHPRGGYRAGGPAACRLRHRARSWAPRSPALPSRNTCAWCWRRSCWPLPCAWLSTWVCGPTRSIRWCRYEVRFCALVLALAVAPAAMAQDRDPILVPEISQHEIVLRQGLHRRKPAALRRGSRP